MKLSSCKQGETRYRLMDRWIRLSLGLRVGFPGSSVVKNSLASAGDAGLIPGKGRCPGERNGNLPQYSCLGNPKDRGAWQATINGLQRAGHDLATELRQEG